VPWPDVRSRKWTGVTIVGVRLEFLGWDRRLAVRRGLRVRGISGTDGHTAVAFSTD
jgi:hypothetical protein